MWVIDGNEFDPRIHQRSNECQVAGEAIQLGNDQSGLALAAERQCLFKFGAVIALACLDFREFGDRR